MAAYSILDREVSVRVRLEQCNMECIAQLVERQVVALVVMGSNPIALPFQLDKTVLKKASYYEKDLESAIITHLADFLLEMARGGHSWLVRKGCWWKMTNTLWIFL